MRKEYPLKSTTSASQLVSGLILTRASGPPLLGVRKNDGYIIDHIPTGLILCSALVYQSQAKAIAREIIDATTEAFDSSDETTVRGAISYGLRLYLEHNQLSPSKTPTTFEDFLNGPDYIALKDRDNHRLFFGREEGEYPSELHTGAQSLAWISTRGPGLTTCELEHLVIGIPRPG